MRALTAETPALVRLPRRDTQCRHRTASRSSISESARAAVGSGWGTPLPADRVRPTPSSRTVRHHRRCSFAAATRGPQTLQGTQANSPSRGPRGRGRQGWRPLGDHEVQGSQQRWPGQPLAEARNPHCSHNQSNLNTRTKGKLYLLFFLKESSLKTRGQERRKNTKPSTDRHTDRHTEGVGGRCVRSSPSWR